MSRKNDDFYGPRQAIEDLAKSVGRSSSSISDLASAIVNLTKIADTQSELLIALAARVERLETSQQEKGD
jgi:hypothetical protein